MTSRRTFLKLLAGSILAPLVPEWATLHKAGQLYLSVPGATRQPITLAPGEKVTFSTFSETAVVTHAWVTNEDETLRRALALRRSVCLMPGDTLIISEITLA